MTSKKTLLLVDDSDFDRALLVKILTKKGGFTVLEATSSEQCLQILESHAVDLVLMDIMMPGPSGTQTLKLIRQKKNPIELPIIMITSKSDALDVIGSLQLGANDYITKPINFEIALSRIEMHLHFAQLSIEMGQLKKTAALHELVASCQHEVNNPLTVALCILEKANWAQDPVAVDKVKTALWRISDIVKKVQAHTKEQVETVNYKETDAKRARAQ